MEIIAPVAARISHLPVDVGAPVGPSDTVVILEVMKMEQLVLAGVSGIVSSLDVNVGDAVGQGDRLATITAGEGSVEVKPDDSTDLSSLREVDERHRLGLDEARPDAVAKRHKGGKRTARENVSDLTTEFVEYGPLAVAAQRGRRDLEDLIRRTPADGMVGGIGRIDTGTEGDDRAVVVSYDYTVLAGTQGMQNHRKKDRLFTLASETGLPVVLFAEGGGGRPGDVDWPGASILDVPAFRLFAEIPGPTVGINTGFCFAGNAALLGQCDVVVATKGSNLGMGGPAMIEGGGLGVFEAADVGPASIQARNGVIDVLVEDDSEAVSVARNLIGMSRGAISPGPATDQESLRSIVPANRRRLYDMRQVITSLVDADSFLELRRDFASAAITGLARVGGNPLGVIANDPSYLAGAIDNDAAITLSNHMRLCSRWGIPILSLCDTPGFMVGPEAEAEGLVRSAGTLFRVAAEISVPVGVIVTRRGYGLGAQAMAAGGFHEPRFTIAWPNSEFGPMGLEGAVKLGFSKELEAIEDPADREAEIERRVEEMYQIGSGLNVASHFEIDDIIDPTDSRRWILTALF